jgi:ABC-type transport system involved in multi-copper enzyme maturation permease subunit
MGGRRATVAVSFLPIVERELRIAARSKSTSRARWWSALVAMLMSLGALVVVMSGSGRPSGNPMFTLLTGYTFALCVFAGGILTADSLSEEKREGTLGLLFLTDLKGYDVVLGKFFARSLNAFYALLALVPITGIPLLIGGVTGGEFWRMALSLGNVLFFSLTLGMLVSTLARDARQAIGATFGLLLLQVIGLPLLAGFIAGTPLRPLARAVEWTSPLYPFNAAMDSVYTGRPSSFWRALVGSNLLGWVFLAVASLTLSKCWQQGNVGAVLGLGKRGVGRRKQRRQKAHRDHLLGINPIYWLLRREGAMRALVWSIVLLWGVALFVWSTSWLRSASGNAIASLYYYGKGCAMVLKMLVAIQACRFFAEARRSGALEALLATPLRNREILRGHWLALRSIFVWPLITFVLFLLIPVAVDVVRALAAGAEGGQLAAKFVGLGMGSLLVLWFGLGMAVDVLAVIYVGSWLALSMKKPNLAAGATILIVLVIPSVGVCGLDLLADLFFILWGSTKLSMDLRWTINQPYQQVVRLPPRTFPTAAPAPPVIPAR